MKFILFLFFIILTPIFSEDNLGFKKKQKIDTNELEVFSEKFFREKKLEGKHVLVAIVKDNKSFFKVYPEHSKAFTELTQFNSVVFDEIFLTLHTLHLEEIGKLNLRSDIYNYKWKYNRNFKQSILIENLLTHTTGIQENLIYSNLEKERPKDFWKNQLPARFAEPNELISYNPDHSVILKSILEEVNSKSLDEVMKETILSKLELEKTNYENQKLNINAKDIEKLLFLFLNPDLLAQNDILKKETWDSMFQEKIRLEDKLPGSVIGFFEHYENKIWGYSRIAASNLSTEEFIFFPDKNTSFYIYTDSFDPDLRIEWKSEFLDHFFQNKKVKAKKDKNPGYEEYLKNFEGEYASVSISSQNIAKFRNYSSAIQIKQENRLLVLESGEIEPYGDLHGRLEFIEIDPFLFRCLDRESYISFKMNEAGDVEYLLSGSGQHGAYRKLPFHEKKSFQESILYFFIGFYSIYLILLIIEVPYSFAKKIAFVQNRMRRNTMILLWIETLLAISTFVGFYYFIQENKLSQVSEYILTGNSFDYALFTLPLLFIFVLSFLAYYSLKSFLEKGLHLYRQIQTILFLVVSLGFIYWMSYWNLLVFLFN